VSCSTEQINDRACENIKNQVDFVKTLLYIILKLFFYFLQWDEHYRKMELKQRRTSIVCRTGAKRSSSINPTSLTTGNRHVSSVGAAEPSRNDSKIHNGHSAVPFVDPKLASTQQRGSREESVKDLAMTPSKAMIKSIRSNSTTKNEKLSDVKNSTTCTIQ
jgi:hypothetical protein